MEKIVFLLFLFSIANAATRFEVINDQSAGKDVKYRLEKDKFQYDNVVDTHFDHKNHAPNDVTYGCFGWQDPKEKLHITFYIADSNGYRPYANPSGIVKIFPKGKDGKATYVNFDFSGKKSFKETDYGDVKDFRELQFPQQCIDAFVNRKIQPVPQKPSTPKPTLPPPAPTTQPPKVVPAPNCGGPGLDCKEPPAPMILYIYYHPSQNKKFTFDPASSSGSKKFNLKTLAPIIGLTPDCDPAYNVVVGAPIF